MTRETRYELTEDEVCQALREYVSRRIGGGVPDDAYVSTNDTGAVVEYAEQYDDD